MDKKISKEDVVGKRCRKHRRRSVFWRVLIGLLFLAAAGIVICSSLGIVSWGIGILWVALIALLGACTIASLLGLQWFGVFLSLAGILTIFNLQTDYLPQLDGQIGALWLVAALLSIGFSILIHKRRWWKKHAYMIDGSDISKEFEDFEEVIDSEDESNIEVSVRLGSTVKYINSDNFKSAYLSSKLGGMKVYFDNAIIKGEEAVIELDGHMSGFELYIPRSWQIIDEINVTAAGVEEKNYRQYDGKDAKIVTLTGDLTMSGVEIIYV